MSALNVNAFYQTNQVTTVGRGQLLLMAYDGALRFLAEAKRAMAGGQLEVQNTNMIKAQNLIVELMATLNHEAFPELARNLERLYSFMYDKLVWANVNDDEATITEVATLLSSLRDAWAEAEAQTRCQEAASTGSGFGGHAA